MTGDYLRIQIYDRIIRPIVAFREYIFRDVLPAFSNIDERANQVAEDYYDRIGAMPAPEFGEIDMADVAENARDHSYAWWEMMNSLRQTMLNLLAAGLFHLTEQQLAALSSDVSFDHRPLNSTKLWDVADWYVQQLRLDIKSLPSWNLIEELRFVANAIKHAEGHSTEKLRQMRPELFTDPAFAEIYKDYPQERIERMTRTLRAPLSGEEFFVTEDLLRTYAEGTESFFTEIAAFFKAHSTEYF